MRYLRPLIEDRPRQGSVQLAAGWCWFSEVEVLERGSKAERVSICDVPADVLDRLCAPRRDLHRLRLSQPQVMGILNVTPDSFSDGGDTFDVSAATARAKEMNAEGASMIDIGGESTRPGALAVPLDEELARVLPVIEGLKDHQGAVVISVDTRKAGVVVGLPPDGAFMVNDVSAMRFDPKMVEVVAKTKYPICLMHSVADPESMQAHATYDDVLLDVYDHLAERIAVAEDAGINRSRIIVDPGIGFGKTLEHNLTLLRGISLFHSLGCPILLGASRKRFIGTLGNAPAAKDRLGGSLAVALECVRQGVQILRVHDTFATKQAIDLHMAISGGRGHET